MASELSVHLPQGVWAAVLDFELSAGFTLAYPVRQRLLGAAEIRRDRPTAATFRVVTLTQEEADILENWLDVLCARADAPRACRAALELVREAKSANA